MMMSYKQPGGKGWGTECQIVPKGNFNFNSITLINVKKPFHMVLTDFRGTLSNNCTSKNNAGREYHSMSPYPLAPHYSSDG